MLYSDLNEASWEASLGVPVWHDNGQSESNDNDVALLYLLLAVGVSVQQKLCVVPVRCAYWSWCLDSGKQGSEPQSDSLYECLHCRLLNLRMLVLAQPALLQGAQT